MWYRSVFLSAYASLLSKASEWLQKDFNYVSLDALNRPINTFY